VVVALGENRVASIGTQFRESLVPVLWFLARPWIARNLKKLSTGQDVTQVVQERRFDAVHDGGDLGIPCRLDRALLVLRHEPQDLSFGA